MANSIGVISGSSRRLASSKPPAPPPPQKIFKCDPLDVQITEDDIPNTLSASHRGGLQSRELAREPHGLMSRKLEGGGDRNNTAQMHPLNSEEQKPLLAHSGEEVLATFYGMLYTNDGSEKEWKLKVDGFISVFFVQVHGNTNKPFWIIAVEGSKRILEYQVNVNTTCAQSRTFVKWQDRSSMFGVRFAKEDQAEQFFSTLSRMASDVNNFAQLTKRPGRKPEEGVKKTSDPVSSGGIHQTKVSLMIKLPNKQTAVMSVPGLLRMNELFDLICGKEGLNPKEHQLSLARTGTRKVTFDWNAAVGSLNIRELSILKTAAAENFPGSVGSENVIEDLVEVQGERNKIVRIHLPSGVKKSFRVALDMTIEELLIRVCSRERLNSRHHSLQYVDLKHQLLDASSVVAEIGVDEIRLMDTTVHRKSTGVMLESGSAPTSGSQVDRREARHSLTSLRKSASSKGLLDHKDEQEAVETPQTFIVNGAVPSSKRRNSSDEPIKKKPPVPPLPYSLKSGSAPKRQNDDLRGSDLKDHGVSPIQKGGGLYASSPDLSGSSSESGGEWGLVSRNIKTSTPESKTKRRAAPPPPPRPARPKSGFPDTAREAEMNRAESRLPETHVTSSSTEVLSRVVGASEPQKRPTQKRRPAPPRPTRPPPPQAAVQRDSKQGPVEKTETLAGSEITVHSEHDKDIASTNMAVSLAPDLPRHCSHSDEKGWRGTPMFIAPPPPDDVPPPLDECETPVGPLTDYEANFITGSVEVPPFDVNGVAFHETPGKPTLSGSHGNRQKHTGDVGEIQREVDEDSKPFEKVLFPIVPPPSPYSEIRSIQSNKETTVLVPLLSNEGRSKDEENCNDAVNVMPPPLLETEPTPMNIESEEKEHDSGFDQSPEYIILTPRKEPLESVPGVIPEDPDSGSSFDVVSTIPPPKDFESRPITPPGEFANVILSPPVDFDTLCDGTKGKEEPESSKKKLNISESLFPWLNEPQAPLDTAVLPAVPKFEEKSEKLQDEVSDTIARCEEQPNTRHSLHHAEPEMVPVLQTRTSSQKEVCREGLSDEEFVKRYIKSPPQTETGAQSVEVPMKTAQQAPCVPETVKIETKSESPRTPPVNQNEEASVQEWGKIEPHETRERNERFRLTRPETKANPATFVREAEVSIETQDKREASIHLDGLPDNKENSKEWLPVKAVAVPDQPEPNIDVVVTAESKMKGEPLRGNVKGTDNEPSSVQGKRPPGTKIKRPSEPFTESEVTGQSETKVPIEPNLRMKDSAKGDVGRLSKQVEPVNVSDKPNVELSLGLQAVTSEWRGETKGALSPDVGPNDFQRKEDTANVTSLNTKSYPGKALEMNSPPLPQHSSVFETPITAETRPVHSANDLLRDPEGKLQDVGENIVVSSSKLSESQREAVVNVPTERSAVQSTNTAVLEKIILPEKRQVEFTSYEQLGEQLFQLETDDASIKTVAPETTNEGSEPMPREGAVDLRLDLSSFKQTSEPINPRPPPSSSSVVSPVLTSVSVDPFVNRHSTQVESSNRTSSGRAVEVSVDPSSSRPTAKPTLPRPPTTPPSPMSLGPTSVAADPAGDKHSTQAKSYKPPSLQGETGLSEDLKSTRQTAEPPLPRVAATPFPPLSLGPTSVAADPAGDKHSTQAKSYKPPSLQEKTGLSLSEDLKSTRQTAEPTLPRVAATPFPPLSLGSTSVAADPAGDKHSTPVKSCEPPSIARETDLSVDLKSFRQTAEPPLAGPSPSSPPAVLPGSTDVLSGAPALSEEAGDEESTKCESSPSSTSNAVLKGILSSKHDDQVNDEEAPKVVESLFTIEDRKQEPKQSFPTSITTDNEIKEANRKDYPPKLQRPLSLPAGLPRNPKSVVLESKKMSQTPEESNLSGAPEVRSSSSYVSPINVTTTANAENLPRPPPLTALPLKRYSNVTADLNFVSSAAKVAEREAGTKKAPTVPLKGSSTPAVERPRSWVASEAEPKKKPLGWSSAFRPVSFEPLGRKVVRPVEFAVKPFSTPSTVPSASTSTASSNEKVQTALPNEKVQTASSNENVQTASSNEKVQTASSNEKVQTALPNENVQTASSNEKVQTASPCEKVQTASPNEKVQTASSNEKVQTASPSEKVQTASPNENVQTALPNEKVQTASPKEKVQSHDKTPSDVMKSPVSTRVLENVSTTASTVSVSAKGKKPPVPRPVSDHSKVGRTVTDPMGTPLDSSGKKYEVIFSNTSSKIPKEGSETKRENVGKGKVASMSSRLNHNVFSGVTTAPAKDISNAPVKREEKSDGKARPQSAVVYGPKFQILPGKEESSLHKENKDLKREVEPKKGTSQQTDILKSAAPWKPTIDHSKKDLLRPNARSQEPVKPPTQPPPTGSSTKTSNTPIKRLSLPTYIIEGASSQQSAKKAGVPESKMHFVMEHGDTDTDVVPQGVVAAMKALREKQAREKNVTGGN